MPQYSYDHVHLIAPDPVKTAEFYESIFGATGQEGRILSPGSKK